MSTPDRRDVDSKMVRAAMYLLRSMHVRPSASKVSAVIEAGRGKGMRKSTVCSLMKLVDEQDGNRSGTVAEPAPERREPILSISGTGVVESGTGPEHHAREKKGESLKSSLTRGQGSAPLPTENGECRCGVTAREPFAADATPESIVDRYLATFVSGIEREKRRHRARIVDQLREMRADGYTWDAIWTAAVQAHACNLHRALFSTTPVWEVLKEQRRRRGLSFDEQRRRDIVPFDRRDISGGDSPAARMARQVIHIRV